MSFRQLAAVLAAAALAGCGGTGGSTDPTPEPTEEPTETVTPDAGSSGIVPQDIPPGFGYPGERTTLQGWADDYPAHQTDIRTHAWQLWAGMTADSSSSAGANDAKLPIWETWCSDGEVFTDKNCPDPSTTPTRQFVTARQQAHNLGLSPSELAGQVVAFNKFNPPMAAYVAEQHTTEAGSSPVSYQVDQQGLLKLNDAFNTASEPTAARKVAETPYTPPSPGNQGLAAIETKPVMFLVKQTGLSPMPLWQGPAGSTDPQNPTPNTWGVCVLLDPSNTAPASTAPIAATPQQIGEINPVFAGQLGCDSSKYLYAPLSTIYAVQLTAAEAEQFNTAQPVEGLKKAAKDDYAVLGAMHVNTKEILNWTWQTFWWQPGGDPPNNFPGSHADKPSGLLKGPWANYAMCTAWAQTPTPALSQVIVCFNPFLETSPGIPAGITSNCMSCHGTATAGGTAEKPSALKYPANYDAAIDFNDPAIFGDFTRTDFSWAVSGFAGFKQDTPSVE